MKTASLPSLRVTPEFREAAESVLKEGETVSMLMETAMRGEVQRRQVRAEFLRRGIESLEEYRRTGVSYSVEEVFGELRERVEARRKQLLRQEAKQSAKR
ncbi:MAG: prevent-host-death protein [Burkholderiales bacterium]|uniref:YlcI/YnfO family protein n=1 Tax=Inhella sp. TaxID=1921806 RepID=UPI001ACC567E|nr:prevent-host-death protein [Burkholderiales bacterium]